jgi:DNA-binding transcriptional regulator YiaG
MRKRKQSSDGVAILENRYIGRNAARQKALEVELENADIAAKVYALRTKTKLSQSQLARLVGTTQSVISRLEDADYKGQSLYMLRRIAHALNYRLDIRFIRLAKRGIAV